MMTSPLLCCESTPKLPQKASKGLQTGFVQSNPLTKTRHDVVAACKGPLWTMCTFCTLSVLMHPKSQQQHSNVLLTCASKQPDMGTTTGELLALDVRVYFLQGNRETRDKTEEGRITGDEVDSLEQTTPRVPRLATDETDADHNPKSLLK